MSTPTSLARASTLTWKPYDGTTFHAGYSRNFTPPEQVLAAPTNLALVQGTTAQPAVSQQRSGAAGTLQRLRHRRGSRRSMPFQASRSGSTPITRPRPTCSTTGSSARPMCYRHSTMPTRQNTGVELKANYTNGNLRLYGNVAWARQRATQVVSNQYLFDPDELAYIANAYVYTDHAQLLTASAGGSYLWNGTKFSADMIFGSGLRNGFANTTTPALLHPGQSRRVARLQLGVGDQADHAALRCRQPVRYASTRSGTAPASACSRRNTDRAAASISAFRRSCNRLRAASCLLRG